MFVDTISHFMNQQPVNRLRLLTHIAVRIACYWLMTTLYWLSLDASGYINQKPLYWAMARWLAAGHIVLLFIAYYRTTRMIYPAIVRERWLHVALQIAGLYVLIWVATYFLYTMMGETFMDDNERASGYDGYFARAGPFYSMTSLSIFLPNWGLYSILLTAVALKVSREIFHVQNRALRLEMNLLRAQINPHFIFNTLNNIYSIVEEKDPYAADILLKFGDIMRYTLHETEANFIGLQQEIEVLNEYIELE